ncbi:MAG: TatD family hydrolase [Planctomycetaceae bacterium]|nr:TatD family hydrolase [Planctomycetaceae bacterium]
MEWFDTHAHLGYAELRAELPRYLELAAAAGVTRMIAVGTDLCSSQVCLDLCDRHSNLWASVGIHPNESAKAGADDWREICSLATHPKVVALGETGLDLYWKDAPLEVQQANFRRHLEHSIATGLPVIIHSRDCDAEILMALGEFASRTPLAGVMHSFTGSWETAEKCLELGLYISFAGMATYKNAENIRSVAARVPANRILVETDCPFLAPHPQRGQRPNHPAMVVHTGRCLAIARQESERSFAAATTDNAKQLFRLA